MNRKRTLLPLARSIVRYLSSKACLNEEIYLNNKEASDNLSSAFGKYIEELQIENRIGTAVSYRVAKPSLESFKSGLKFADISPALLKRYEAWMIQNGKSKTTVGIYLRSLRAIFNMAKIDKTLYPFGKNKYTIPSGRNVKKALLLKKLQEFSAMKQSLDRQKRWQKTIGFLYTSVMV